MVMAFTAVLTVPLTVALCRFKKPCICKGFNNLNTEDNEGYEVAVAPAII